MKRWLAGLLSVMILFSGGLCLAENAEPMENADIQETVVSVEGESLGTLSENIRFLKDLAADEEVRELLGMEEVKTVTSEVIWRVLVWLYRNRIGAVLKKSGTVPTGSAKRSSSIHRQRTANSCRLKRKRSKTIRRFSKRWSTFRNWPPLRT